MSLSSDPEARARQLANLNDGLSDDPAARARQIGNLTVGSESSGTAGPGNDRALTHGLRARLTETTFDRMCVEVPAIRAHFEAICEAVPVREEDGGLCAGDLLMAQVVAMQAWQVAQAASYFADRPDERMQSLALWSLLTERLARAYERLGIGPAARARLGVDVARGMSLAQRMAVAAEDDKEGLLDA